MNRLAKMCVVLAAGVILVSATSPSVDAGPLSLPRYSDDEVNQMREELRKLDNDARSRRHSSPAVPPAPATPAARDTTPPPAAPTSRSGVISGRLMDTRGDPLQKARVRIHGPSMAGQDLEFSPRPDANGEYSVAVPRGNYSVEASVDVVYERRTWSLPLHPTDNDSNQVSPEAGVRKDFRWRLSGPHPRSRPDGFLSYYGRAVMAESTQTDRFRQLPRGSMVRFTLTPTGPLIDGSRGRPLVFERTPDAIGRSEGHLDDTGYLYDIPIGPYRLSARLRTPDGHVYDLFVSAHVPGYSTYDADIAFDPNSIVPPNVYISASWRG